MLVQYINILFRPETSTFPMRFLEDSVQHLPARGKHNGTKYGNAPTPLGLM
jgi:hypothetical protein